MHREWLEERLSQGLSLEDIGEEAGKHASTISYWIRRHGLAAVGTDRFAPKGPPERARLEALAAGGATLDEMATELERSMATVRYWLRRWDIPRLRRSSRRPIDVTIAPVVVEMECESHGTVPFRLEGRGYYRCMRCRQEAESRRRVKRLLVEEAGGRCAMCGYDRCAGALQFHHVDPSTKEFGLSDEGVARSLARARAEAQKCVLLCANCHAEVENGIAPAPSSPGWIRTTMA